MTPETILLLEKNISKIKKRDGREVPFESEKIKSAIRKAFIGQGIHHEGIYENLTNEVITLVVEKYSVERTPTVEEIQDLVETVLILNRYTKVAKAYILYRAEHERLRKEKTLDQIKEEKLFIIDKNGERIPFRTEQIQEDLRKLSEDLNKISVNELVSDISKSTYDNMPINELKSLIISVTKAYISKHYEYSRLSSRLVLDDLYDGIINTRLFSDNLQNRYQEEFRNYISKGVEEEMLNPELKNFDLRKIAEALESGRDLDFYYLGMQTLYDRYLIKEREPPRKTYELPQWMWMRVAMGLSLNEDNREDRAIEFYNTLSQFYVISSTPTLFNSGTLTPQMSSCFLNTVEDSMTGIFKNYADNAHLCKWAGAVGTDWTPVRSKNSFIKGTNGKSQGIIPWLKIFNDCAVAVNQGGKRTGQLVAYLETWHADIEEFAELKKNTGDERRRTHDIHTAVWIPDLFMQRIKENKKWTLFPPNKVPGLHDAYGLKFKEMYEEYETKDIYGKKEVNAVDLWKKILTMLFETGHPWITFKDPCNLRSPQDHMGVVHASNLCTEITLNTNKEETAVCNLASVNLSKFVKNGNIDEQLLEKYVTIGIRMLNNVIDSNFYTIPETRTSNMRHRPIGLGLMGYQDALYQLEIDYDSEEQLEFADRSMEMISYYAILASSKLAKEFGSYQSYKGSKWDRGLLPYDTLELLEKERGQPLLVDRKIRKDWTLVREHIKQYGMRNSNCMAIAPTATIANISGVVPCVEPTYKNMYMKENMSGSFMVINRSLIDVLEKAGLYNKNILTKIRINDGSILNIDEIPAEIRRRFKEVFEIDPKWIIRAAAVRSKWIDQAASTNIFLKTQSGKQLSDIYQFAWESGLKTTYYLRTLAASQVQKMVDVEILKEIVKEEDISINEKNIIKGIKQDETEIVDLAVTESTPKACSIYNEDCESCQ